MKIITFVGFLIGFLVFIPAGIGQIIDKNPPRDHHYAIDGAINVGIGVLMVVPTLLRKPEDD